MKLILRVAHKYAIGEIIFVSNHYQDFIIYGGSFFNWTFSESKLRDVYKTLQRIM